MKKPLIERVRASIAELFEEVRALEQDVEQRRHRIRFAVELLRETFTLRPDCNNIEDAVLDACNEMNAERTANAEQRCAECGNTMTTAVGTELKFEIERLGKELRDEVGRRADALEELEALRKRATHCVDSDCEEEPMFCTEHAGVAVTVANQQAEEFDEQG